MPARLPRPLLWSTALVLLAHAWLLSQVPATLRQGMGTADASGPQVAPTLQLRRIEAAPAATAPATVRGAAPGAVPGALSPSARVVPASSAPSPPTASDAAREAPGAAAARAERASDRATEAAREPTAAPLALNAPAAAPEPTVNPTASAASAAANTAAPGASSTASNATGGAAAGTPLGPLAIPGSTRLRYVVYGESRGRPYQVSATLLWQHDGQQYDARYEVSAWLLGARTQTSRGRITTEGLAPTRFGDRFRSEQAAHFQRDKGIISFSSNAPDAPLRPGAQDRLSVLLQLAAILGGDPQRHPPQSTLQIQTASTRDAEPWVFRVIGPQSLQLPGGTLEAVKLERLPRREYDQHIEVWLAPAMDHLPVRLRITQGNGDVLDQQWLANDKP